MRYVVLVVLACMVHLSVPAAGAAQAADTLEVQGSRSALLAGALEWYLPLVGYGYAGDLGAGLLPNTARLGGVMVLLVGVATDSEPTAVAGAMTFAFGTVWAVVGAARAAARRGGPSTTAGTPGLMLAPAPGGGVSVVYRWSP